MVLALCHPDPGDSERPRRYGGALADGRPPRTPAGDRAGRRNYNHLHEQPTIFYAVALTAQLAGAGDPTNIGLAWTYVALRIAHSFVQATKNVIPVRFAVFTLGSLVLMGLWVRTLLAL